MRAFHIFSSAPFFAKNPAGKLITDKTEIYCAVISALEWRRSGGTIDMLTDSHGTALFGRLGISCAWNSVKNCIADDIEGINPKMFWAGAKLLALRDYPAPCVMLDTDFIVWRQPEYADKLIAAHEENLKPDIYPDISHFRTSGFTFADNLDYSLPALNTAFLYMPDEDFKQYYVSQSLAFMKSAHSCDDYLTYMVFAEQRLLTMLANKCGIQYECLMDKDALFFPQNRYTHLWGAKQAMRDDAQAAESFVTKCRERIRNDYPQYSFVIDNIESFYNDYKNRL